MKAMELFVPLMKTAVVSAIVLFCLCNVLVCFVVLYVYDTTFCIF